MEPRTFPMTASFAGGGFLLVQDCTPEKTQRGFVHPGKNPRKQFKVFIFNDVHIY